jgi:hypothetical protein
MEFEKQQIQRLVKQDIMMPTESECLMPPAQKNSMAVPIPSPSHNLLEAR